MDIESCVRRYFISYSGVKLPLQLVNELDSEAGLENRNTYFCGYYDADQRIWQCEKLVYGEVELRHCYSYHDNGVLSQAEITDVDGEVTVLSYDGQGQLLAEN